MAGVTSRALFLPLQSTAAQVLLHGAHAVHWSDVWTGAAVAGATAGDCGLVGQDGIAPQQSAVVSRGVGPRLFEALQL